MKKLLRTKKYTYYELTEDNELENARNYDFIRINNTEIKYHGSGRAAFFDDCFDEIDIPEQYITPFGIELPSNIDDIIDINKEV